MIRSVRGRVVGRGVDWLLLETPVGVGYRVFTNASGLQATKDGEITLYTHLHVREQELSLYGFVHLDGVEFFEALIGVNGVGPKSALSVMNLGELKEIIRAIALDNAAYIAQASGIGKKTAGKIILELKDKLALDGLSGGGEATGSATAELRDALLGLGYAEAQVHDVAGRVDVDQSVEQQIRQALKLLAGAK